MANIFRYDSPLIQKANVVTDFLLLNICYVICCLPIVTIGPAKAALYAAQFSFLENADGSIKIFFKNFKNGFRQAFLPGLMMVAALGLLCYNIFLVLANGPAGKGVILVLFAVIMVIFGLINSQIFHVMAKFNCTFRQIIGNALLLAVSHPLRSLIILALQLAPYLMAYYATDAFLKIMPIWLLIYFSLTAYFCVRLMYNPYMTIAEQAKEKLAGEEGEDVEVKLTEMVLTDEDRAKLRQEIEAEQAALLAEAERREAEASDDQEHKGDLP